MKGKAVLETIETETVVYRSIRWNVCHACNAYYLASWHHGLVETACCFVLQALTQMWAHSHVHKEPNCVPPASTAGYAAERWSTSLPGCSLHILTWRLYFRIILQDNDQEPKDRPRSDSCHLRTITYQTIPSSFHIRSRLSRSFPKSPQESIKRH